MNFDSFKQQQYMNLTTYRKNGQAMPTPVWFIEEGGRLYLMTQQNAGKVKRIRNNAGVLVGPSDARGKSLGPTMAGTARILADDQAARIEQLLNQKYGLFKRLFDFFGGLRGPVKRAYIEIAPGS